MDFKKQHDSAMNIDKALMMWFAEEHNKGTVLTEAVVQEKARQLNKSLNGDPRFAASNGWFSRWKKRNGIIQSNTTDQMKPILKCETGDKFTKSTKSVKFNMSFSENDQKIQEKIEKTEPVVLIVEPFYGGSHKQLIDTLMTEFGACCELITLPSTKWPWRARCSALILSQLIPQKTSFKVLFCSSVLNLPELLGLRPDLQKLKKIVYFHENQLVYPKKEIKKRDFQFGYNQITTCIAADTILFNSMYNLNSFTWNMDNFIKIMPDCRPKDLFTKIRPKTSVLYYPINFSDIPIKKKNYKEPLHIIWPHRWEFDKNPEALFSTLLRLKSGNANFRVSVLGERFSEIPQVFEKAKKSLQNEILHWGYIQSKEDYYEILNSGHIVLSTAIHEFYGVAMLEAVYCGCYPLVPDRLVYPEIYDKPCLYKDENDLFARLKKYSYNPASIEEEYKLLTMNLAKYDSTYILPKFKEMFLS